MNVVDSSGWLEYFADSANADFFAQPVENTGELIVPSSTIYEVFKSTSRQRSEQEALKTVALMMQGHIIDLDVPLAVSSARISANLGLSMADSIIIATARAFDAVLWTQDAHFEGLDGVRFLGKANGVP
ncbi:MAG: twitching motility protein PilT [Chloroflexi bacterium RBG_16_57_8]|nr:MAG: twitching motility protein PilT [Chloroflexi bacterium RBG_16_57_8]